MGTAWCGVEWGGAFYDRPPVTALAARDRRKRPESDRRAGLALGPGGYAAPAFDEEREFLGLMNAP